MIYTYRFANLLSDTDVTELELSNVRFDRRIIVPGSFTGTAVVSNPTVAAKVRKIVPGKTVVHIYRGPEIWGTYIIWQAKAKSNGPAVSVEFSGASLESYFYRRIVDFDIIEKGTDQIDILRTLVHLAQIGWWPYSSKANISVSVTPSGVSGIPRDRTYKLSEAVSFGQRMEELANVDGGFEYMIRTFVDGQTRKRELVWGYPKLNMETNLHYFYPGNIKSYELSYDATEAATAFWARGDTIETDASQDSEPLMTDSPVLAGDFLSASWPHLDRVLDYPSVSNIDTLWDYARYWASRAAGMVVVPVIETVPDGFFSPNMLGATAIFTITDPYFPLNGKGEPSFTGSFRIVGVEVSPPERGRPETRRFVIETDVDLTSVGK